MTEIESLSSLVGDIYDAALEPQQWSATLARAAAFVGGQAAALFTKSVSSLTGANAHDSGIDPHLTELYFGTYVRIDPLVLGQVSAAPGMPTSVADLLPYDDFLDTRFYREWVQPQGYVDFAGVVLDKFEGGAAMFGVFRHADDGLVDEATRQRMRLLVPHVQRAALIAGALDRRTAVAANLAESLDGVSCALFLLDADGRLLHANLAARRMLEAADCLWLVNGRLAAREPADGELGRIVAAAADGDGALGIRGIALPLASRTGERFVAHALPLASDVRRNAGSSHARLALFVHSATAATPAMPATIARAYGLTLTELRVLLAVVEVGGAPEVADALGIAPSTVKTHLSRLYEKTGMRRQADLVKLVSGYASPLLR